MAPAGEKREHAPESAMKGASTELAVADLDVRFSALRLAAPTEMSRLRASVVRDGIRNPVLATTAVEKGRVVIVDGLKRVRVARELGIETVWVRQEALEEAAAKAAILLCNAPHRGLCDIEEAWVVRSLYREHRLKQRAIGQLLGRDKSWVCRRLGLAERLEEVLQDDVRLGLLSAATARELSRLPRGNQIGAARAVQEHGLTSRQSAALVRRLLSSEDPMARREVLEEPLRYVSTAKGEEPARTADARLSPGGNEVRRSLLLWEGAGWRLLRSLRSHAPAGLVGEEVRLLGPVLRQAVDVGVTVVRHLEQVQADSGERARPEVTGG
jgi:ParB-like chromosome segregation protein Spo0J